VGRETLIKINQLVPVSGQRLSAAGKVTVGLASHFEDFSGLSTYGLKA